ncbi:MAG: UDP-N-acetylglucosamine 2-epimerase (non-hydrolyzing), partial [Hyphomicrobiales bacterium]
RPEAIDAGSIVMTGLDESTILSAIDVITGQFADRRKSANPVPAPQDYCIDNTSVRVLNIILGTAGVSHQWDGVRTSPTRLKT